MLTEHIVRIKQAITSYDPWQLAAKLTLFTLLLSPVGGWSVRPFILGLSVMGLLIPGLWRSRYLWLALTLLTAMRCYLDWPLSDNHAYLLSYWCLALTLTAWFCDQKILFLNAKYLISLTFALAAWQKWSSPDYINGVFFLSTFLLDERFEDFVVLFSSITYEQIDVAREYFEGDYYTSPAPENLPFTISTSFWWLAILSTAWNLFEQTLIAITFLVPEKSPLSRLRAPALLIFCFSIYAVVPVVSFGWLLLAMGIAVCDPGSTKTRLWYLFAFITLIFYYEIPWAQLLVAHT